jgi:hypothetical protein
MRASIGDSQQKPEQSKLTCPYKTAKVRHPPMQIQSLSAQPPFPNVKHGLAKHFRHAGDTAAQPLLSALEQDTASTPRCHPPRWLVTGRSPFDPLQYPCQTGHRNRPRTPVVVRHRGRYRDDRRHRRAGGLQQAPRPYDDLARLPRAEPRQGRCRRSTATRGRRRPPVRSTGGVGAPAPDAGINALTRCVPRSGSLRSP